MAAGNMNMEGGFEVLGCPLLAICQGARTGSIHVFGGTVAWKQSPDLLPLTPLGARNGGCQRKGGWGSGPTVVRGWTNGGVVSDASLLREGNPPTRCVAAGESPLSAPLCPCTMYRR